MCKAENAMEARDLHIADLTAVLKESEVQVEQAEEEAKKALEEKEAKLREAEARIQEMEAATEARAAAAVEEFRASGCFAEELADATAESFLQGFQRAKEQMAKAFNLPQALEIELEQYPEAASDHDEPVQP